MKFFLYKRGFLAVLIICASFYGHSQGKSIKDLNFLIGTWQIREENIEKTWWEETTRKCQYILDSTYIELISDSKSSSGKERTYRWYIHYNSKSQQYEMLSIFSNWHKAQFDLLEWDQKRKKMIIRSGGDPGSDEYHDRFGEMIFNKNLDEYTWTGENKSGDPIKPSIWRYIEKGKLVYN